MITKKNFKCERCGECCKAYTVILDDEDIKNIISLGYEKESFAEKDLNPENAEIRYVLKRDHGQCIFLQYANNKATCLIYEQRPKICKIYPFFHEKLISCKPKELSKSYHFSKSI